MNRARFRLRNAAGPGAWSPSTDRGFAFLSGAEVQAQVEDLTVRSVEFQVYDADEPNSPLASLDAPVLTLTGATSGTRVIPETVDGFVSFTGPAGVHSWKLRCVVNGGYNERGELDSELVFERVVFIRSAALCRKVVWDEATAATIRGWADAQNEMIDAMEAAGVGAPGPLSVHQELSAAALVDLDTGDVEIDPNLGTDITLVLDMGEDNGDYEDELASVTLLPLTLSATQAGKVVLKVKMGETPGKTVASWVGFTFAEDAEPDLTDMAAGETKAITANVDGTANQPLFIASPRVGGFPAP